jgi:hypothetical protein
VQRSNRIPHLRGFVFILDHVHPDLPPGIYANVHNNGIHRPALIIRNLSHPALGNLLRGHNNNFHSVIAKATKKSAQTIDGGCGNAFLLRM